MEEVVISGWNDTKLFSIISSCFFAYIMGSVARCFVEIFIYSFKLIAFFEMYLEETEQVCWCSNHSSYYSGKLYVSTKRFNWFEFDSFSNHLLMKYSIFPSVLTSQSRVFSTKNVFFLPLLMTGIVHSPRHSLFQSICKLPLLYPKSTTSNKNLLSFPKSSTWLGTTVELTSLIGWDMLHCLASNLENNQEQL